MMLKKLRLLRHYLAYQIFFSFLATFAIVLAIAIIIPHFDVRAFNPLKEEPRHYFLLESKAVEEEYNLDEVFRRGLSVTSPNGFDVILLEPETGQIIGVTDKELNLLQAFILKANDPEEPLKRRFDNLEFYGPFIISSSTRKYHQYFLQQTSSQQEILNRIFDSPWIMLFVVLIVSTPIILWQSYRIAKPVKELRLTANAVATGNLTENPKLESEGITELRQVGTSFNQMIFSLQRLRSYQQRLISDVSHELKTPLTRIQLALSLMRRRNGESSEIQRIETEIQKLDQMIQDLLTLSRRNLNTHTQREIFNIEKIWEEVLEDARFEFDASGFELLVSDKIPTPSKYHINGNPILLASAVENVLRNAKKYARHTVKMMTQIEQKKLRITIDDDGEGVPSDQYEEIFRPFYRVGDDRARQTGGTGLGLAIVANAVEHHHGEVFAEKSPFGGLRVNIFLPLWIE